MDWTSEFLQRKAKMETEQKRLEEELDKITKSIKAAENEIYLTEQKLYTDEKTKKRKSGWSVHVFMLQQNTECGVCGTKTVMGFRVAGRTMCEKCFNEIFHVQTQLTQEMQKSLLEEFQK